MHPTTPPTIEINALFERALDLLEKTSKNVFITGKAGTGKSTLLDYFRNHTKKQIVVLAPTGVAAINVKGETIHSFFRFKPDITLEKVRKLKFKKGHKNIYKETDILIIDEISMVRSDLLDCVDKFLRLNGKNKSRPFGGMQMVFIGDLYQLPPVVTSGEKHIFKGHYNSEYFFDARSFKQLEMEYLELEKVYRQTDDRFIRLLNTVRNNSAGEEEIALLNQRLQPDFKPKSDYFIHLTSTNALAAQINDKYLNILKGQQHTAQGIIDGEFANHLLPTDLDLKLKVGAQIMLLNNDPMRRWVNGTLGKIHKINNESLMVQIKDGKIEEVFPYQWDIFHFKLNAHTGAIETDVVGSFTQYPLRLAWAITIHKSQGKTFDHVIIDLGRGTFAHGQMYVALSRCRTLGGLVLKHPIKKSHIIMDFRVVKFITGYQYALSEKALSLDDKIAMLEYAIKGKRKLEIVYLKAKDEKSKRVIQPIAVGTMIYENKEFLGVSAYCHHRNAERVFRVDRILEMQLRTS